VAQEVLEDGEALRVVEEAGCAVVYPAVVAGDAECKTITFTAL